LAERKYRKKHADLKITHAELLRKSVLDRNNDGIRKRTDQRYDGHHEYISVPE
jgi:hypothetical protein